MDQLELKLLNYKLKPEVKHTCTVFSMIYNMLDSKIANMKYNPIVINRVILYSAMNDAVMINEIDTATTIAIAVTLKTKIQK